MHIALKDSLYKKAKDIINSGNVARIWTAYDDSMDDYGSDILDLNSLKEVFKYCYNMGWPVIRVEEVNKVDYIYNT